jgi:hypothetical protein
VDCVKNENVDCVKNENVDLYTNEICSNEIEYTKEVFDKSNTECGIKDSTLDDLNSNESSIKILNLRTSSKKVRQQEAINPKALECPDKKVLPIMSQQNEDIIDLWNSLGLRNSRSTPLIKSACLSINRLQNGTLFNKVEELSDYKGRVFTVEEITDAITYFSLAVLDDNYKPDNSKGYKSKLRSTSIADFFLNMKASVHHRSLFVKYLQCPELITAYGNQTVSNKQNVQSSIVDPNPDITKRLMNYYTKKVCGGESNYTQKELNDFVNATVRLTSWWDSNRDKIIPFFNPMGNLRNFMDLFEMFLDDMAQGSNCTLGYKNYTHINGMLGEYTFTHDILKWLNHQNMWIPEGMKRQDYESLLDVRPPSSYTVPNSKLVERFDEEERKNAEEQAFVEYEDESGSLSEDIMGIDEEDLVDEDVNAEMNRMLGHCPVCGGTDISGKGSYRICNECENEWEVELRRRELEQALSQGKRGITLKITHCPRCKSVNIKRNVRFRECFDCNNEWDSESKGR